MLSGCGSYSFVYQSNNAIVYDGYITKKGLNKFEKILSKTPNPSQLLIIRSQGGEVIPAIKMANIIYNQHMDIQVKGFCASSCANYIFPAGNNKFLEKHAVLLWHGGALSDLASIGEKTINQSALEHKWDQKKIEETKKIFLKSELEFKASEKELYQKLKIDPYLPVYGHAKSCLDKYTTFEVDFFYYALEDMEKMGLKNIQIVNNEKWEPEFPIKNIFQARPIKGKECE